jgi:hypothetical protein
MYFQLAFAVDRIKALAKAIRGWEKLSFKAVPPGTSRGRWRAGLDRQLVTASHAGMTTEESRGSSGLLHARHPGSEAATELTYQPMLERAFLRAHGFKTYTPRRRRRVQRTGRESVRHPARERGGSTIRVKYELRDGKPGARPPPRD